MPRVQLIWFWKRPVLLWKAAVTSRLHQLETVLETMLICPNRVTVLGGSKETSFALQVTLLKMMMAMIILKFRFELCNISNREQFVNCKVGPMQVAMFHLGSSMFQSKRIGSGKTKIMSWYLLVHSPMMVMNLQLMLGGSILREWPSPSQALR